MYYKKSELTSPHWPLWPILPCTVHVNTWGPHTASLPWLRESRQRIQMGPKQPLLPNSTETPSPTHGWEALPRMVLRGASSQGPRHRVMGRRDLSGDDRPWGKAPGECVCTGVRQDASESDTVSESREGHFRKAVWESTENMTLPEKEPCLTPVLSSSGLLRPWVFTDLSWKLKTCCLMHMVNTPPSWAPTIHTGKPSPCGTDSALWPLSRERLRMVNSRRETNTGLSHTFPRITLPSWWGFMSTAAGGPPLTPWSPSGHTVGPGPAPLRAECPPLPQGPISVSEVEAKSPGAQCRIQIGIICGLCTFLGRGPTREPEEHVCWGRGTKHAWAKCLMISCDACVEH